MIGQRVTATLWKCQFRYRKRTENDTWVFQHGQRLFVTADPTGGDALEVVRLLELGSTPHEGHEFCLTELHRIEDIGGVVQLPANDRGWPAGLDVGAVVLEAGTHQQAAIGRLGKELALARAENTVLKAQLVAAGLVPVGPAGAEA